MRKSDDWLGSYIEYNKENEVPHTFHLWCGLWAISAAIGRKAWMDFHFYKVYPNLFTVLTGPPATHKSTACILATSLLEDIDGIHVGPNMTTMEAMIARLEGAKEFFSVNGEDIPHSSMAVTSPEWSNLLGDKNTDLCNTLCELYDCNKKFDKWTKTQGSEAIKNVCITMLAGSTVKQITNHLPPAAIGAGFTSRIIFVVADEVAKERLVALPIPTDKLTEMREVLVNDLRHMATSIKGEFKLSPGARLFYEDWYKNRKEPLRNDDKFIHYCDRKPIHVLKVAMLLSASRDDSQLVTSGEISEAINLLNAIEPRMPEALGGIGISLSAPIISSISNRLRENRSLTRKQLQGMLWRDANSKELKEALTTMLDMGVIALNDSTGEFVWKGGK